MTRFKFFLWLQVSFFGVSFQFYWKGFGVMYFIGLVMYLVATWMLFEDFDSHIEKEQTHDPR